MTILLDGKKTAEKLNIQLQEEINYYVNTLSQRKPGLAIIQVDDNPASTLYVNKKQRLAKKLGFHVEVYLLKRNDKLLFSKTINDLNNNKLIDGFIIQLPLPHNFDTNKYLNMVSYEKDVDGFSDHQQGWLLTNQKDYFLSATPQGVINLLDNYDINVKGMKIVMIGTSRIVGMPLGIRLMQLGGTVTFCNNKTPSDVLKEICLSADMIISAVGKINLVTSDMVKENSIVIDIGTNFINGKTIGDVDFDNVSLKTSFITPVPGGVGPMTINALLNNCFKAYLKNINREEKK